MVLKRDDYGVGMYLCMHQFVQHQVKCYTINCDASDGCDIGFIRSEYAVGGNGCRLDGCVVIITDAI